MQGVTRWAGTMVWLLVWIAACGGQGEVTLDELTARHVAAMGGRTVLDRVRALEIEMRIEEPSFAADGVYRVTRDGRMRVDIYMDGARVFTEAYDGSRGWQMGMDTTAVGIAAPQAAAALWRGTQYPENVVPLDELEDRGHEVSLAGRDTLDGVAYYVLELTMSDGFVTYRYVNPRTWLIERKRDVRAIHPDLDPTEKPMETRWSDFREVDGLLRPFRSEQWEIETDSLVQTTTIRSVRVNPDLDSALFEAPESGVPSATGG